MAVTKDFFERERIALEAATGGKNTYLYDDLGYPSVMVKVPKFMLADVFDGAPYTTHPAFIVNGVEKDFIYVSKYMNIVQYDRAYSIADKYPAVYMNFDQAAQYCKNKGAGWHLMTNAEWAAIALWCRKNGTIPHGNNLGGCEHSARHEAGVGVCDYGPHATNWNNRCFRKVGSDFYSIGRTLTGSGPDKWNHDWTPSGITDLNGNCWDWVSGFRLKNGEIQVIPDNNAAAYGADLSDTSGAWKAILQDGSLVPPGTANTLKINGTVAGNNTQTPNHVGASQCIDIKRDKPQYTGGDTNEDYAYSAGAFEALATASSVSVPNILKYLALAPAGAGYDGDIFYCRNYGERLPLRGGAWLPAADAGVFALHLADTRALVTSTVGFRSAFC